MSEGTPAQAFIESAVNQIVTAASQENQAVARKYVEAVNTYKSMVIRDNTYEKPEQPELVNIDADKLRENLVEFYEKLRLASFGEHGGDRIDHITMDTDHVVRVKHTDLLQGWSPSAAPTPMPDSDEGRVGAYLGDDPRGRRRYGMLGPRAKKGDTIYPGGEGGPELTAHVNQTAFGNQTTWIMTDEGDGKWPNDPYSKVDHNEGDAPRPHKPANADGAKVDDAQAKKIVEDKASVLVHTKDDVNKQATTTPSKSTK